MAHISNPALHSQQVKTRQKKSDLIWLLSQLAFDSRRFAAEQVLVNAVIGGFLGASSWQPCGARFVDLILRSVLFKLLHIFISPAFLFLAAADALQSYNATNHEACNIPRTRYCPLHHSKSEDGKIGSCHSELVLGMGLGTHACGGGPERGSSLSGEVRSLRGALA
eukprot:40692-Amphidinium_carterae.1